MPVRWVERRRDSISTELLQQSSYLGEVEEFPGPRNADRLVLLPIEVPCCSVHRDDERGVGSECAFQKSVVSFVSDDTELGQRIADREALDNLGDEFRMVGQDISVLFQDSRTDPRFN